MNSLHPDTCSLVRVKGTFSQTALSLARLLLVSKDSHLGIAIKRCYYKESKPFYRVLQLRPRFVYRTKFAFHLHLQYRTVFTLLFHSFPYL